MDRILIGKSIGEGAASNGQAAVFIEDCDAGTGFDREDGSAGTSGMWNGKEVELALVVLHHSTDISTLVGSDVTVSKRRVDNRGEGLDLGIGNGHGGANAGLLRVIKVVVARSADGTAEAMVEVGEAAGTAYDVVPVER